MKKLLQSGKLAWEVKINPQTYRGSEEKVAQWQKKSIQKFMRNKKKKLQSGKRQSCTKDEEKPTNVNEKWSKSCNVAEDNFTTNPQSCIRDQCKPQKWTGNQDKSSKLIEKKRDSWKPLSIT